MDEPLERTKNIYIFLEISSPTIVCVFIVRGTFFSGASVRGYYFRRGRANGLCSIHRLQQHHVSLRHVLKSYRPGSPTHLSTAAWYTFKDFVSNAVRCWYTAGRAQFVWRTYYRVCANNHEWSL